ncbi:MAG: minor capsid protein, partial [Thermodesulfovibrionia bacterium]|nr:minor capsid protein [Thermodesulfovibrionia bacterium]
KSQDVESEYEQLLLSVLKDNENKIKELISQEVKPDIISQIKSEKKALDDIIKRISDIISIGVLKKATDYFVRTQFMKGWDTAEKELDRNFIPDPSAIKFIENYSFDLVKGMTEDISNRLKGELSRGLIEGEGVNDLKARVTKVFDVSENRAEMIARTESQRATSLGKLQAYKASGEKAKKVWITTFDNRTCPLCKRMHNQEVDLNDSFKDPNTDWKSQIPLRHPRCRCVLFIKVD